MKTFNDNPLQIGVISLFPEIFQALEHGMPRRAMDKDKLALSLFSPRDYSLEKHKNVDDKAYGGGPGMVMSVQPLRDSITAAKSKLGDNTKVVYLSPQGKPITQALLLAFLAEPKPLVLVAGRYEGIDERVVDHHVDEEWSLGDMVLSGGEIAALAVIDALARLLPGVLGSYASATDDSFMNGLLDFPHYTRPDTIDGNRVPEVLVSGDHQAIERWRKKQSLGRTWLKRPDLLERYSLNASDKQLLDEFKQEYLGAKHV